MLDIKYRYYLSRHSDGNGNRKVEGGWPGYCYFIGWALTVLFICEK